MELCTKGRDVMNFKCESVAGIWVELNIHHILKPVFTSDKMAEQITYL
jgi:hypothetical protein